MILHMDDSKTIGDLQDKFEECFSGLKIEFYSKPHSWQETTSSKYLLNSEIKLGDIMKPHSSGILELKSWFQAGKVEEDFKELFGLNVQIFRSQNGRWIQTSKNDHLTLAQLSNIVCVF